ncbi:MAG: phosphate-transport ATP-binding protein transporter pstB [Actinomycetia bacterium]|nr:phosphate-transport ATP-binding protein transporter pstB [Actinomycetes bacterium]
MPPLFELDGVTVAGRERPRLDAVSGRIPEAGITVLAGPSGAGKSTLLRCCNRLEAPESGTVRFRGADIATLDPRAHRRRVGMVFQAPIAFPGSVLDNLRVADPDVTTERAAELLERVDLGGVPLQRDAGELSGGEAQRMVLARCLATGPHVLLLDEPTSALDGHASQRLEALARDLAADGLPLLWVTHDLRQMRRLADHLVVVIDGHWAWDGHPDASDAPAAVAAFLDQDVP